MCVCVFVYRFRSTFEDRRADIIPHLYNIITTIVIVGAIGRYTLYDIISAAAFHTLLCPINEACVCAAVKSATAKTKPQTGQPLVLVLIFFFLAECHRARGAELQ